MGKASERRMRITEHSTPAVVVDLDVLEHNLDRMATYCAAHGLDLRPHTKTHKTLEVAHIQLALAALGLTVAKVGDAEVMAQTEVQQILVAPSDRRRGEDSPPGSRGRQDGRTGGPGLARCGEGSGERGAGLRMRVRSAGGV